jgi:hypothetical protein
MWMRIQFAGHTVCGPTGVRDSEGGFDGVVSQCRFEFCDFAQAPATGHFTARDSGNSGRVIASIFEALQTLKQDWDDVSFSDCADNTAHFQTILRIKLLGREKAMRDILFQHQPDRYRLQFDLIASVNRPGGSSSQAASSPE